MKEQARRFIFIGGLHRSGTSPLFRLLKENPEISGFDFPGGTSKEHEGQHLQSVYPHDGNHGGPGYFGFKPEAHLTEASDLVSAPNRDQLFDHWSSYWNLDKPCLLEKTPANLIQMRFLQALFEDSTFIIILRHPIAVSLATWKWMGWPAYALTHDGLRNSVIVRLAEPDDVMDFHTNPQFMAESMLFSLMKHWEHCHAIVLKDLPLVKNACVIRYEDFVAQPEMTIQQVCERVGVPGSTLTDIIKITDQNMPYFQEWSQLQESVVSPEAASFLISRFKGTLSLFGYGFEESPVTDWTSREPGGLAIEFREY